MNANTNANLHPVKIYRIPVVLKRNEAKEITKAIYPQWYRTMKDDHNKKYKKVMNDLDEESMIFWTKVKDNNEKDQFARMIYNIRGHQYMIDPWDMKVEQTADTDNGYRTYLATIDNEKWRVSFSGRVCPDDDETLFNEAKEYIVENISTFTPLGIWNHLKDIEIPQQVEEIEESTYEDTDTKCPICLNDYDEEDHTPQKLYRCGHKYCDECFEGIQNYGSCGICRCPTSLEQEEEMLSLSLEDVEDLCDANDDVQLLHWFATGDCLDEYVNYCIDSDGYAGLLGFDYERDFWGGDGGNDGFIFANLDEYESKQ